MRELPSQELVKLFFAYPCLGVHVYLIEHQVLVGAEPLEKSIGQRFGYVGRRNWNPDTDRFNDILSYISETAADFLCN